MNATINQKLATLLRDFGYEVRGNQIIERAIRGFCGERVIGKCRDLFDAAEQLRPIVHDDEFTRRHMAICII